MKININETVKVQLTDLGRKMHRDRWVGLGLADEFRPRPEDSEGWSEWQLWELMNIFGRHLANGLDVPFKTEIIYEQR